MIISEEKDYFIYGCITTVFIESVLCIFYGYCCETKWNNFLRRRTQNRVILDRRNLIKHHGSHSDSSSPSSNNSEGFIDL